MNDKGVLAGVQHRSGIRTLESGIESGIRYTYQADATAICVRKSSNFTYSRHSSILHLEGRQPVSDQVDNRMIHDGFRIWLLVHTSDHA